MLSRCQRQRDRWEPTLRWERRYREVLHAAASVFAEKSYDGREHPRHRGAARDPAGQSYYYFPSKEAALAAICELGVKDFIANLERIIAEPAPRRQVRAAIANHLAPLRAHPEAD